ncbi:MAG TPA: MMPL family transporter [Solirubrobacterales bacterium]|nr:MMPL family transporter [Solirubrobacterales bacterium]
MRQSRNRLKRPWSSGLLEKIAGFVTRRSRLVIAIWIVAVAALAVEGRDLDSKLTIHPPFIDGTASKRAHEISLHEFGGDNALVVMLRGPRAAVESQGRDLASRLDAMPRTLAISPWARGATIDGLRPSPRVAAIVVRIESDAAKGVVGLLPPVRRLADRRISSPVHVSMAGFPVVVDSLRKAGNDATKVGELIAVPVLLIVLLLVFRSVLAALMPVIVGGAVVAATRGVLSLLLNLVQIDLFALAVVGMLGLALGVDYSLLVVSRFREEFDGGDVAEAVRRTVTATARSVVPAGGGLVLAMVMASLVLPGAIVQSIGIAVVTATILSVVSAICVVPALLSVFGGRLDRWSLPKRESSQVAPLRWSRRLAAHRGAVVSIVIGLVLLASWAFTLDSEATGTGLLPPGDAGRQELEDVESNLGPGWIAPMEVVVNGRGHPVTSSQRLQALAAFQHQVERDPGVQTMAGLARLNAGAKKLVGIEGELGRQERGLERLGSGITRIRAGAVLNSNGLHKAAEGSRGLDAGLGAANAGAGILADALGKTSAGSSRLSNGLQRADEGSGRLAQGTTKASTGAGRLADALDRAGEKTEEAAGSAQLLRNAMHAGDERLEELRPPLHSTEERLAAAWQALQRMTTGRTDPEYAAVQGALEEAELHLTGKDVRSGEQPDPSYAGIGSGVDRAEGQFGVGLYLASRMDKNNHQASVGIRKLADASERLDDGLQRLAKGSRQVSNGVGALARGGGQLSPAMQRLDQGAKRLAGGLGLLETGAGRLADGLGAGAEKSKLLTTALDRVNRGLKQSGGGDSGLGRLKRKSPGLFRSAYFIMAGLDGSRPEQRGQLASLINLDRGGMNARMLVIPTDPPTSDRARETKDRLEADAEGLARRTGTEVVVGGVAPSEIDVNDSIRGQAPLMRIVLSLVSLIILIPVMRSLTIPIFAALINLITVSASFGLLSLLFDGSLLGGPGFVDASVIPGTMMVMFGLAIDYEVFVFARIREEYLRTGSTDAAIKGGLDRTAHVVTGAAIIMISVFLAFSVSEFVTVRNFGVAQAIAVFIDAFLVRLIVVPAVMGWLGEWCWWMPRWPTARSRARPG